MAADTPPVALPVTRHSVFYSYTIFVGTDAIGSLQSLTVRANRLNVERIREIYYNRGPITQDIVWGGVDITLDATRVELYSKSIYKAFGYDVNALEEINFVVNIMEQRRQRTEDNSINVRTITYYDCVPESWSRTIDTGTARVAETMTFQCRTMIDFAP